MGGFQAVGVASIYQKVNRLETEITWMCDLYGQTATRRISGWCPDYSAESAYYDSCYLASRVACPATVYCALADDVCPLCGLCAMYNNLNGEKSITFKQNAKHSYDGGVYNASYYVEGEPVNIDPMYHEIPVTGIAEDSSEEDGEREQTAEEKEIAAITAKLEKEKYYLKELLLI